MAIKKEKNLSATAELRRLAEERLSEKTVELHPRTAAETQRLFHELEVHQAELEMQNAELRRAQEELEVSRNRYAELYDFAPVGYFTFDAHGLIQEVNLTGAQLLGIERRLLAAKPFSRFIADSDGREIFSHHLEAVLQRQGLQRCEIRLTGKNGTVIYGQLQSVSVEHIENKGGQILSSIVDDTVGKQLETKIQDAREYAENIVETVREPLVVLNSELKILTANHSFYDTFKVTPEATIGNFIYDLGNRQWDIPKLRVLFEEILPHDTVINGYEVEHDFIDIGRKIILLSARQIFREDIGSRIILLAMEDITERKLLEEELQKAHDKLEITVHERTRELTNTNVQLAQEIDEHKGTEEKLQKKNTEVEQFIYTVSHDLRSPLVTVKTFMGFLEKDMAEGNQEHLAQDIQFIHGAADKMKLLLDELLEMSRIGRVETPPVRVSLAELATEALDTLAGIIKERTADIHLPDTDLMLFGDRPRLCQIWQNLIENAVRYSRDDSIPRIGLGVLQENGETVFFVKDDGIGIAPEYLAKIFGIFEKLDPKSPGAGLGLSMVQRIVEKCGGRIWVESEGSGKGTCFFFTLPHALLQS